MRQTNRDDLLALVASLYYEQDQNQQQIAEQLQISRSNISRLLKEAKEKGIVEVRIRKPIYTVEACERQLVSVFSLKRALVLDNMGHTTNECLPAVGELAARYLEEVIHAGDILAISWGSGVYETVTALPAHPDLHADVVQMIGSVGSHNPQIDGTELARSLAEKLGGRHYYLHAPVLVDNPIVRDMLLAEAPIQETLNRARRAHIALVGIGTTEAGQNSFVRAGHLTEMQLNSLRAQGSVGEICGQHFDLNGGLCNLQMNRRVVGIELGALKRIPIVLALACGLAKARSILAALRGGYISALATDDQTARAVLELADQRPAAPAHKSLSIEHRSGD